MCGLYEILYNVLMISGSCLRFYLFWPLFTACTFPDKGHRIAQIPKNYWVLNNPGFHLVSSKTPLYNTICRDLYYRIAKMERILSTFTLLSLHLTGLVRITILKHFPCKKMVNRRILPCLQCSCYWLLWKQKCLKMKIKSLNTYLR